MRGGAQADMVLTDDGLYVVKWQQNPQSPRILINEVIGSELLRRLRIASPDWAMVHVDEDFVGANPAARICLKNGSVPVGTGWHFGSRVPVNPEKNCIFDFLPGGLLPKITNLKDFFRVFVFDLWTDNNDGRQAIFYAAPGRRLTAQMIDNGFSFGFNGTDWLMRDQPLNKTYPLRAGQYLSPDADVQFEAAIADIQAMDASDFEAIRQVVPDDWIGNDRARVVRLFDELRRRARRLPDLLSTVKTNLIQKLTPHYAAENLQEL
jgi:hypothetical protein